MEAILPKIDWKHRNAHACLRRLRHNRPNRESAGCTGHDFHFANWSIADNSNRKHPQHRPDADLRATREPRLRHPGADRAIHGPMGQEGLVSPGANMHFPHFHTASNNNILRSFWVQWSEAIMGKTARLCWKLGSRSTTAFESGTDIILWFG